MKKLLLSGIGISLLIAIALCLQSKPKETPVAIDVAALRASKFSDATQNDSPAARPAKHPSNPLEEDTHALNAPPWTPKDGEASIHGMTIPAYNHVTANEILHNNRINDPAMQSILKALITNNIPMGYSTALYNDLKMSARLKRNSIKDPKHADSRMAKIASMPEAYSNSNGMDGLPPISEEKLGVIQDLFDNAPAPLNFTNQPWPLGFQHLIYPDQSIPVDQWYKPGDVLQYIREHPGQANGMELPYPNQVTAPSENPSGGN